MREDGNIEPTSSMWLAVTITRGDGTLGNAADDDAYNSEGLEGVFATEAAAVAYLKNQAEGYGAEGYVYSCTPTRKVFQSKRVRVQQL